MTREKSRVAHDLPGIFHIFSLCLLKGSEKTQDGTSSVFFKQSIFCVYELSLVPTPTLLWVGTNSSSVSVSCLFSSLRWVWPCFGTFFCFFSQTSSWIKSTQYCKLHMIKTDRNKKQLIASVCKRYRSTPCRDLLLKCLPLGKQFLPHPRHPGWELLAGLGGRKRTLRGDVGREGKA